MNRIGTSGNKCGKERSKKMKTLNRLALAAMMTLGWWPHQASAQVIVPILPKNLVSVTVSTSVTFDSTSDLYTYQYEVSSDPSSVQEVDSFRVQFIGTVQDISAPHGWL